MNRTDWFERFVTWVVFLWRIRQQDLREKRANPNGFEEMSRYAFGRLAEEDVARRLERMGYRTAMPPGSRTPADVYACRFIDGVLHIALVQVKASRKGRPAVLRDEDIAELSALAAMLRRALRTSSTVPRFMRSVRVVVSTGYVGVAAYDHSSYDLRALWITEAHLLEHTPDDLAQDWIDLVDNIHSFDFDREMVFYPLTAIRRLTGTR